MVRISETGNSTRALGAMPPGVFTDLICEACSRLCGKKAMDYNEVDIKHPHLPKGASVPRNQVAGHKHEGRSKLGLLEHEDGSILKAMQKPPRGTRELDFYKRIFDENSSETDSVQLRTFMPGFYGVSTFDEYQDVRYLKLENIAARFRKPCVVDVKMGQKTYDPEAGPAKIAREMTKFPHVEKFGFQFTGMQTYDPVEETTKFYDKFYCRKLGEEEILRKGLGTFFNLKHGLRRDAIREILNRLYTIKHWFESQRTFSFYASSLLIVYEGDTQSNDYYIDFNNCDKTNGQNGSENTISYDKSSSGVTDNTESSSLDMLSTARTDESSLTNSLSTLSEDVQTSSSFTNSTHNASIADVRMIDFTHVFFVNEQDDNYLYGLRNLISNLEQLLKL